MLEAIVVEAVANVEGLKQDEDGSGREISLK